MIGKLLESKTIVFALVLSLLVVLIFIVAAAVQVAFGTEVPYVSDVLTFFQVTFLGASAKNAVDNNAAPIAAAMKSGVTDAPPVSKWGQSAVVNQPMYYSDPYSQEPIPWSGQ